MLPLMFFNRDAQYYDLTKTYITQLIQYTKGETKKLMKF